MEIDSSPCPSSPREFDETAKDFLQACRDSLETNGSLVIGFKGTIYTLAHAPVSAWKYKFYITKLRESRVKFQQEGMQNMQQIYYSCLELMNAINRFALSTKKVTVFKNSDLSNPTDCIQVYHPGFYEKGGIPGVKIPTCTLTDFLSMWKIFLEGHSKDNLENKSPNWSQESQDRFPHLDANTCTPSVTLNGLQPSHSVSEMQTSQPQDLTEDEVDYGRLLFKYESFLDNGGRDILRWMKEKESKLDLPTLLDPSNEISALVRQHPHILLKKNLKLLSFAKSLPCLTTEYFANLERIQKFDILVMKHRASE